jgi:hypothetical protein
VITLVTQYDAVDGDYVPGWDGADGPYLFHTIDDGLSHTTAPDASNVSVSPQDWTEDANWLTNFRLELIYG